VQHPDLGRADTRGAVPTSSIAISVDDVLQRIERLGDLFSPVRSVRQALPI
jgi:hypothetical protein